MKSFRADAVEAAGMTSGTFNQGPIVKNRAFFFPNYEGFCEIQKFPSFSSIRFLADRQGIFTVPVRTPGLSAQAPADEHLL